MTVSELHSLLGRICRRRPELATQDVQVWTDEGRATVEAVYLSIDGTVVVDVEDTLGESLTEA